MKLDNIDKPCTFYYEDEQGNNIPFEFTDGFPHAKWYAQHLKCVEVHHTLCFGSSGRAEKDMWPIRAIKWILKSMPVKWKKPQPAMSFSATINCSYPIVKYLVEQRKWSFNEACVLSADLCERCLNLILDDLGSQQNMGSSYYTNIHSTHCDYCEVIDAEYYLRHRVWCCYRTLKLGGSITKAFKECGCYSAKD